MTFSLIFCCGGNEEFVAAVGRAAPSARIVRAAADALPDEDRDGDRPLVVLCDPSAELVARLRAAQDQTGLPRWPVVSLVSAAGPDHADPAEIPPSLWEPAVLQRLFAAEQARHELERANAQLRGDLLTYAARIAHDIRTPLGGVLTTTEMLREVLAEQAPAEAALTQPILDSVDGLARLIERSSRFARAVGNRPLRERFDVGSAFWNAFQQLESRILKAGAALTHARDWPAAEGNAACTELVWRELLANALDHGGGQVRIEAGWAPDPHGHRFWVWDSGVVPEDKRATLFHPFHRLHAPGAPRGLGLPMVRRLVELQGGRCGFELPPSGGSRFYFVLPPAT